jgi:hypothetical protein
VIQHSIRGWRFLGLTSAEQRCCLRRDELDRHNRRVQAANMPKHGLDYEAMVAHRRGTSPSILDTLDWLVRAYAPAPARSETERAP